MSTSSTTRETLLTYSNLTFEQQDAISRLYEFNETLLIASKGFGKAVVAQTAAQELLDEGVIQRVLVIAPPKVCNLTWANEWRKWSHLEAVGLATGDQASRDRVLGGDARIVVVSADNLKNVLHQTRGLGVTFDGLVIDEISRFKSVGGKNFRALRPLIKSFKWRVGLSATPVAEAGIDIYGQALLLDNGQALGRNKDRFLRHYFVSDYSGYQWEYQHGAEARLAGALAELVWIAPDTNYQASLPPLAEQIESIELPPAGRAAYEELAATLILEAEDIEAANAAVLAGKLQQVASGFIYDADGDSVFLHGEKRKAVRQLVARLDGPVVIMYQFLDELAWLRAEWPEAAVLADAPEKSMAAWNAGEIDVLLIHPRSAAHGINLQAGGHVLICLAPCWSADQWDQVVGRLWRRGQTETVYRYTVVAEGTVDGVILDRLSGKKAGEAVLMQHLKDVTS